MTPATWKSAIRTTKRESPAWMRPAFSAILVTIDAPRIRNAITARCVACVLLRRIVVRAFWRRDRRAWLGWEVEVSARWLR